MKSGIYPSLGFLFFSSCALSVRWQEAKWRAEERSEQLSGEVEGALTQTAKLEMEARAAATKAESDLRSAISAAEGMKADLNSTRAQVGQEIEHYQEQCGPW